MESLENTLPEDNERELFGEIEEKAVVKFEELVGSKPEPGEVSSFLMDVLGEYNLGMLHRFDPEKQRELFDDAKLSVGTLFDNVPESVITFYRSKKAL